MAISLSTSISMDVETVIKALKAKGVSAVQISERLGIERGEFYSWRTSVKPERREELKRVILAQYGSLIEATDPEPEVEEKSLLKKLVQSLERTLELMEKENQQLRAQVEKQAKQLLEK